MSYKCQFFSVIYRYYRGLYSEVYGIPWYGINGPFFVLCSDAIAMLPDLKNIFEMDPLVKRTFLLLCPVEIYGDLLQTACFSCLELCVTMRKLLSNTKGSSSYTENFVSTLRKLVFFLVGILHVEIYYLELKIRFCRINFDIKIVNNVLITFKKYKTLSVLIYSYINRSGIGKTRNWVEFVWNN